MMAATITVREAQELLATERLVFGDPIQIAAVALLSDFERLKELGLERTRCKECDGVGRRDCDECGHYGDCSYCDGTGSIPLDDLERSNAAELKALLAYAEDQATELSGVREGWVSKGMETEGCLPLCSVDGASSRG